MGGMMSRKKEEPCPPGTRPVYEEKKGSAGMGLLKALAWFGLLCLLVAFGLLLGATAALQNGCGDNAANQVLGGIAGFAQTSCDKLYGFPWWITFFTLFVFILVLIALAMSIVHLMRPALIGLLAVLAVLLMFYTNYFYFADSVADSVEEVFPGDQGDVSARSRVWMAGGIIGSIGALLLILTLGIHDEGREVEERPYKESGRTTERRTTAEPAGTQPVSTV